MSGAMPAGSRCTQYGRPDRSTAARASVSSSGIEPEVDPRHPPIVYTVEVRRDVAVPGLFGIAFLALLVPAIAITWRSLSFERARWAESDHPPIHIGSSED